MVFMKNLITNCQRIIYDNPNKWGKKYLDVNKERAKLTLKNIPRGVGKILDLGSGDGLIFNILKYNGYNLFAFDISISALQKIESKNVIQGTANHLPFASNTFDLISACEVLEHIPCGLFKSVLNEIERVCRKYILITVPYRENLEINFARCEACGSIFNGAYHVRSFNKRDLESLFYNFECIRVDRIVNVLNPDRTVSFELFIRHHLARDYLYYGPSVKCPLCLSAVNNKPGRNWCGWIAAGMRYIYRLIYRKKSTLWYMAVYKKIET